MAQTLSALFLVGSLCQLHKTLQKAPEEKQNLVYQPHIYTTKKILNKSTQDKTSTSFLRKFF